MENSLCQAVAQTFIEGQHWKLPSHQFITTNLPNYWTATLQLSLQVVQRSTAPETIWLSISKYCKTVTDKFSAKHRNKVPALFSTFLVYEKEFDNVPRWILSSKFGYDPESHALFLPPLEGRSQVINLTSCFYNSYQFLVESLKNLFPDLFHFSSLSTIFRVFFLTPCPGFLPTISSFFSLQWIFTMTSQVATIRT